MSHPAADRQRDGRVSSTRLALLAISVVILALLALTLGPGLTGQAMDSLRAESDSTSGRAQRILGELNLLVLQGIVEHQNIRLGSGRGSLDRYRHAREAEDVRLRELIPLALRVGPATHEHALALQALMQRWNVSLDARADGRMDDHRFTALLPQAVARRDSVFAELRELTDDLRDAGSRERRAGALLIQRERGVSLAVGVLAILAVIALVWFAWRDRLLTLELERALDEEARLRGEAEERGHQLEEVTESRNRLMRGFTHDVKNPIGAADGFLQLMQDGILDPLTERQQHAVSRSRSLLATALRLIGDLLDVARTGTDDLSVSVERMDVAAIATELVEEYRPLAVQKGLLLVIDGAARPVIVHSDPMRVRQVLGNLISNAVKYTERGQVTVRVREPAPPARGNEASRIALEVTDTGAGIPADKQGQIFQEFVRLDPGKASGAGVGLAISRRIAHALRGDITVESTPGTGSTFVLWLPCTAERAVTNARINSPRAREAEVAL
jgi:signal transduction histidine kinase